MQASYVYGPVWLAHVTEGIASQPVPSALALQSYNLQIALVYVIGVFNAFQSFTAAQLVKTSHALLSLFN